MDASENELPLNPADGLAIIDAQRELTRRRSEPDPRFLFALWGLAWLIGYAALFSTAHNSSGHQPAGWSFVVFGLSLGAAIALTIIHVIRRTAGVHGVSARSGAMYGWSWSIGFIGIYLIASGLDRAGANAEVLALAWNALPILLVGILYLTGGAIWQMTVMYALGVWFVLLAGVATVVGLPNVYLIMAIAGGGGMLLGAVLTHLNRLRVRGRGR